MRVALAFTLFLAADGGGGQSLDMARLRRDAEYLERMEELGGLQAGMTFCEMPGSFKGLLSSRYYRREGGSHTPATLEDGKRLFMRGYQREDARLERGRSWRLARDCAGVLQHFVATAVRLGITMEDLDDAGRGIFR